MTFEIPKPDGTREADMLWAQLKPLYRRMAALIMPPVTSGSYKLGGAKGEDLEAVATAIGKILSTMSGEQLATVLSIAATEGIVQGEMRGRGL
jgi:hypothetical protein